MWTQNHKEGQLLTFWKFCLLKTWSFWFVGRKICMRACYRIKDRTFSAVCKLRLAWSAEFVWLSYNVPVLQTATLYPALVFGTCFFLNFFIWGKHSSGAVPFGTMLSLLCLWFGISVPLVYLGYYFGFRKQPFQHPVRTNQIPRQVPDQLWYMNPLLR